MKKARLRWAHTSRVLAREGARPKVSGFFFYKAVVQAVLLYGSETCMGPHILDAAHLERFSSPGGSPTIRQNANAHWWLFIPSFVNTLLSNVVLSNVVARDIFWNTMVIVQVAVSMQ